MRGCATLLLVGQIFEQGLHHVSNVTVRWTWL